MITKKKIEIYQQFDGNIDGWARTQHSDEMNDSDWALIDSLVQDIRLIKKGIASNTFITANDEKLKTICDNDETIEALKALADN